MFKRIFSKMTLLLMLVMILTAAALPTAASAAATPLIDIVGVKPDESVTIRANDFPANVDFIVRMDASGNRGENGLPVASLNSGRGGAFEATIPIPAQLKGVATIAIRLESKPGWFAYNWFTNKVGGVQPTPQPAPTVQPTAQPQPVPVTGPKPFLSILAVRSNELVELEARNMPANTNLTVRVGPFVNFYRDYVTTPTVRTDANGYARWTVTLPAVVQNVEMVTVRIDGGGRYAFNAFENVTRGTVGGVPVTSTGTCQVTSVVPTSSVGTRADLDVVWTVKNTSSKNWEASSVDYKYVSGSKIQKRGDAFDLPATVKPGESIRIVLDVTAPTTAGNYSTNWAIMQGNTSLCNLSYTLKVK